MIFDEYIKLLCVVELNGNRWFFAARTFLFRPTESRGRCMLCDGQVGIWQ